MIEDDYVFISQNETKASINESFKHQSDIQSVIEDYDKTCSEMTENSIEYF